MKRFFIALGVLAAICLVHYATTQAAPYPPALGGTGSSQVPASGTVPIGNGAGTYTPASLICVGGCTVTSASGSITITAASSSAILTNTGNWAGTWQLKNPSDFLSSSTSYVSSVNGMTGAVTITFPATTTINGTQAPTFFIVGDNSGITSTVSGATTTFKLINTGNWAGTWQGVNSTTFYLASNPNGYISSLNGALLIANNLSDLANSSTARSNIGYTAGLKITVSSTGTISLATTSISQWANDSGYLTSLVGALLSSNNLSDLNSTSSARTNIGFSAGNKISISSTGTIGITSNNVSQFTNDSGYLTSAGAGTATTTIAAGGGTATGPSFTFSTSTKSGSYNVTSSGGTVTFTLPSNVGFFTNDSGFLTSLNGALLVANNLSDLASTSSARTNLGYTGGSKISISATGTIGLTTSSISQFANDSGYLTSTSGALLAANNLSDLASTSSARTNIGYTGGAKITISATGTIGITTSSISQWANDSGYLTSLSGALLVANNLSDLNSTSSARTNIGYTAGSKITISATGTIGVTTTSISQWNNDGGFLTSLSGALLAANNLSDLNSTSSARTNIGYTAGNKISISSTGTIGISSNNLSQFTNDAGYSSSSASAVTTTIAAGGGTSTGPAFNFATSTKSASWNVTSSGSNVTFTIPSNVGFFTNDANYLTTAVTSLQGLTGALTYATSTQSNTFNVTSSGSTIRITIPSNLAFFTNDSGFITAAPATTTIGAGGGTATGPSLTFQTSTKSGSWNVTSSGGTVTFTLPSNVSFFTNDAGYGSSTSGTSATTTYLTPLSNTANVISVSTSSATVSGILTFADWNTFNGKVASVQSSTDISVSAATTSNIQFTLKNGVINLSRFVNDPGYGSSTGANPSANITLSTQNGSAATFMRSDAAPALSQSITPTWTGLHTFNNGITTNSLANGATLQFLGMPPQSTSTSLIQIGSSTIQNGNASGTFIGINATGTYKGDFINIQKNSSTIFLVNNNYVSSSQEYVGSSTAGTLTVNAGGITQSGGSNSIASTTVNGNLTSTNLYVAGTSTIGGLTINSSTANTSTALYVWGAGTSTVQVGATSTGQTGCLVFAPSHYNGGTTGSLVYMTFSVSSTISINYSTSTCR